MRLIPNAGGTADTTVIRPDWDFEYCFFNIKEEIMAKFTQEQVIDYADKLLIGLTDEEINLVLDEFEDIDTKIDLINKIPNIASVEPMTHCLDDFEYVLREDEVEESVSIDELLQNCESKLDREVCVPKVVE